MNPAFESRAKSESCATNGAATVRRARFLEHFTRAHVDEVLCIIMFTLNRETPSNSTNYRLQLMKIVCTQRRFTANGVNYALYIRLHCC